MTRFLQAVTLSAARTTRAIGNVGSSRITMLLSMPRKRRQRSTMRDALGRRVLEMQRFAGMDSRIDGMRRHRRLGEAGEDELQLVAVGRDVADREDAGPRGLARRRIDDDVVALESEPPFPDRPEIHRQSEEGKQRIGLEALGGAVEIGDDDMTELAAVPFERMQLIGN